MVEVTGIMHRVDPIYQVMVTGASDVLGLVEIVWAGEAYKFIKDIIPAVQAFHLIQGSALQTVVVSISKENETDPRKALIELLLQNPHFKKAIAVDDDVDITNAREVEWALAARFRADDDLILLPHMQGSALDPSSGDTFIHTKIGIFRPSRCLIAAMDAYLETSFP